MGNGRLRWQVPCNPRKTMLHRKKQPEIQGNHLPEYSAHANSAPWYFYACFWPHIATGPHGRDGLRVCGGDRPRGCPPHPCGVAGQVLPPRGRCGASAFRIGHRAGTAVLPPCSTPQQLTEQQNKNTRRGTAGAFILVELTGVEPVSEKKAVRVSPGAVHLLKFPQCERVHTLDTLVAS